MKTLEQVKEYIRNTYPLEGLTEYRIEELARSLMTAPKYNQGA